MQAVGAGARLVVGGRRNTSLSAGSFMTPTLLVDVTRDMDIARNEVFGWVYLAPPMCVYSTWVTVDSG